MDLATREGDFMASTPTTNKDSLQAGQVLALPCRSLLDNPLRMTYYNQTHLAGLTTSIKENGLLEPILVNPLENGQYCILSGHYRIRAVRRLKQPEILSRILCFDEHTAMVVYCTQALLTRTPGALEEAYMMAALLKEGFNMTKIALLWGKSKSWVSRRIKLLNDLDPHIKQELGRGNLKPRLAQELARLPRGNEQARVLALIRQYHLNKANAAQLIHWWLDATETERCRLEKEGGYPLPKKITTDASPEKYTKDSLKRCTLIIDELTVFLAQKSKPFSWWPKAQYQSFLTAVDTLGMFSPEKR
jgi:ParB/RepB/Spo0J family partition protein